MDSPVTKLIFIAAAVAAAALVVGIMWQVLSRSTPQTTNEVDYPKIQTQQLCEAVGGVWSSNACAAKS